MREPLFSGETWEMSDSLGSGSCAPSPTPQGRWRNPWDHLAGKVGRGQEGLWSSCI